MEPAAAAAANAAAATTAAEAAARSVGCLNNRSNDPSALRRCLGAQQSAETRAEARPRLVAMSRALRDYATLPRVEDGLLAVHNTGRPAAWCESLFNDVIALRNVDVVDDPQTAGALPAAAADVLDPDFRLVDLDGRQVVHGYVTIRWRGAHSLVLRTQTTCPPSPSGPSSCARQPYIGVVVHDAEYPIACNLRFIGRAYWPNWQGSMTRVSLKPPR